MLYLVTSLSHLLYFFVWIFTNRFLYTCYYLHVKPLFLISSLSIIQKSLQIGTILNYSIEHNTLIPYIENFNIMNLSLLIIGQSLNTAVYNKLGLIGVYYGNRLGYELPYITTFPYNIGIKNPQYVGCVLTLCGLYPLIDINYLIYSSGLYCITTYIEEH